MIHILMIFLVTTGDSIGTWTSDSMDFQTMEQCVGGRRAMIQRAVRRPTPTLISDCAPDTEPVVFRWFSGAESHEPAPELPKGGDRT